MYDMFYYKFWLNMERRGRLFSLSVDTMFNKYLSSYGTENTSI